MYEECGNIKYRLWKPKNIFQVQHIIGSQTNKIRVDAAPAHMDNCTIREVDNKVMPNLLEHVYRAGIDMTFEFIARDIFGNFRGKGYIDNLELNVTLNNVVESDVLQFI
jgi:hypothetical protein